MSDKKPSTSLHWRIADLNDDDKPREKALANGIRSLTDTELLTILIGGGLQGKSAIELSREIYQSVGGSLSSLARMSLRDMCSNFLGIGPAKAVTIAAALELGARRASETLAQRPTIRSSADAYTAIRGSVQDLPTEEFWIIILSRANRILAMEKVAMGGVSATYVEPRVIFKRAIEHMASAIILVHNHPSGNLNPSKPDDDLTRRLKSAGQLLDIAIHDHIIVGPGGYYSYADNSRL